MALLPTMDLPVTLRVSASLSIAPPEPLPPPGPPWAVFPVKVLPWIVSVPGTGAGPWLLNSIAPPAALPPEELPMAWLPVNS